MQYGISVDEGGQVFSGDNPKIIDIVLSIICAATKMRDAELQDMFQNDPAVISSDNLVEKIDFHSNKVTIDR